jgi:hypothetical protein
MSCHHQIQRGRGRTKHTATQNVCIWLTLSAADPAVRQVAQAGDRHSDAAPLSVVDRAYTDTRSPTQQKTITLLAWNDVGCIGRGCDQSELHGLEPLAAVLRPHGLFSSQ